MKAIRALAFLAGFTLALSALAASFWSLGWFLGLVVAGMFCLIVGGLIDEVDDDCGYAETVQGRER